jgi:UDP-glucuronate 4-epimerase
VTGPTYLVTGALGCVGAWTLRHLTEQGKRAVSFDLSEDRHRLELLLPTEAQAAITFVKGDLTEFAPLLDVIRKHEVTHIIHLAALQVPFCRADPVLGAKVNVVGTVNIFEAAKQAGLRHLTCASSVAVYGPPDAYPPGLVAPDAPFDPRTLYGVYKQANEGTARIYWQDHGLSSTVLRPFTVYGVGRDQGVTSEPTKAMLAAAAGRDYHLNFGGTMQFHFASDVARQFIAAAETPLEGAYGFNLGTQPMAVSEVARLIEGVKPGVRITHADTLLPFPEGLDAGTFTDLFPNVEETSLQRGIQETIRHFEACLADARVKERLLSALPA